MDILTYLENAINDGEPIKIIYKGGSQPGRVREIVPIKLNQDKLHAFCVASQATKTFSINKIEPADKAPLEYDPHFVSEPEFKEADGLTPIYEKYREQWDAYGWHVEYDNEGIKLYRKYKNGNCLKYPTIQVYYDNDIHYRPWEENETNPRPWNAAGRQFKYFDKAVKYFIERSFNENPIAGKR